MFLRKLMVVILPLLLCAAMCMLLPLLNGLGFWSNVLQGVLLGGALALLLPLSGATRRKEPFAGMLWLPMLLMILTVGYQYVAGMGLWSTPALAFMMTSSGQTVLVECLFIGFMAVSIIRTKK